MARDPSATSRYFAIAPVLMSTLDIESPQKFVTHRYSPAGSTAICAGSTFPSHVICWISPASEYDSVDVPGHPFPMTAG